MNNNVAKLPQNTLSVISKKDKQESSNLHDPPDSIEHSPDRVSNGTCVYVCWPENKVSDNMWIQSFVGNAVVNYCFSCQL